MATSYVCRQCAKEFKLRKRAVAHADATGHKVIYKG